MMLVGRSMPAVEQQLLAVEKTMLLVYPGLLARARREPDDGNRDRQPAVPT